MKTTWNRRVYSAGALSLLITVAACGSDDDASDATATTSAESSKDAPERTLATDSAGTTAVTDAPATTDAANSVEDATAALYERAKAETEEVIFYSLSLEATNTKLVEAFNEAYPDAPDAQAVTVASADFAARFGSENDAGTRTADVVLDVTTTVIGYHDNGWLMDFDPAQVPEANEYATRWHYPWGTVCMVGRQVITYNRDLVGDNPPTSLEDLLAPEYRGKVGFGSPVQAAYNLDAWYVFQQELGTEFLEQFPEQEVQWFPSATQGVASVASGEIIAFWPSFVTLQNVLAEQGAPVESVGAEVATGGGVGCGVSSKTKSPNTARLFLSFMLSDLGQNILSEFGQATVKPGVPAIGDYPEPYYMGDDYVFRVESVPPADRETIIAALDAK